MEKFNNKYRISSARAQWWDYGCNAAYFVTICTQNKVHSLGKILLTQFTASQLGTLAEKIWFEIPNQFPFVELGAFVVMPNHVHGIVIIDKPLDNFGGPSVETRLIASLQSPLTQTSSAEISLTQTTSDDIPFDQIASTNCEQTPSDKLSFRQISSTNSEISVGPSVETRLIASLQSRSTQQSPSTQKSPSSQMPSQKSPSIQTPPQIPSDPIQTRGGFAGHKNPMLDESLSTIIRWYKGRCSFEFRKMRPDFNWQSRFHDHIIRNDAEYQLVNDYIETNPLNWEKDKFYKDENL